MNKKGSHVDWAISIGIFLVYLIGLFILLRPGVTPVHKPEGLLNILEDRFNEEVMWEVREIPIILQKDCRGEFIGGSWYGPSIELKVSDDWKFSSVITPKPNDGVEWSNGVLRCSREICEYKIEKPKLEIGYTVIYYPNKKKWGPPDLVLETIPEKKDYCEVILGASISKFGINRGWLGELKSKDYNDLKDEWGFPEDKDFAIYENDLNNKINGAEVIPQGVNVFSKEIKTNFLSNRGELDSVTIIIQVW